MKLTRLLKSFVSVVITILFVLPHPGFTLPQGGESDTSDIAVNGTNMDIHQHTDKSLIEWAQYNVGVNEVVNYYQPGASSLSVNRIHQGSITQILGSINANGQVWLLNPNGVLFGSGSSINTAGLLASTLNLSNQNYHNNTYVLTSSPDSNGGYIINKGTILATGPNGYVALLGESVINEGLIQANLGKVVLAAGETMTLELDSSVLTSSSGANGGYVINKGIISATGPNGYVALLGEAVINEGLIQANLGKVVLAAGETMTLELDSSGMISIALNDAVTKAVMGEDGEAVKDAVLNTGTIETEGGTAILTAKVLADVFENAVNNEGVIKAKSLVNKEGEIYLLAEGDNARISSTGTLDVSATEAGANGGYVEICADRVRIDGTVDVTAADGEHGEFLLDPWNLFIID